MKSKSLLLTGALFGALAVAIGAFGAHALKGLLEANGRVDTFELATRYQFYHALALLLVGLMADKYKSAGVSGWFFLIGILLFSGSLYVLSLTGERYWGAVTPLGGVAFIAGWLALAWSVRRG